jgi:hypothetical protein
MTRATLLLAVGLVCVLTLSVSGWSSTEEVSRPGEPISEDFARTQGWPEALLTLLNDQRRGFGYKPWFSECPNDVTHYELRPVDVGDLNRLIRALDRLGHPDARVVLMPGVEPRGLGYAHTMPEDNGVSTVFSIGHQPTLDAWFKRLRDGRFGVHHFKEPPRALPPTLTIYVDNPIMDWARLDVPARLRVNSGARTQPDQPEPASKPLIDAFIECHGAKVASSTRPANP